MQATDADAYVVHVEKGREAGANLSTHLITRSAQEGDGSPRVAAAGVGSSIGIGKQATRAMDMI